MIQEAVKAVEELSGRVATRFVVNDGEVAVLTSPRKSLPQNVNEIGVGPYLVRADGTVEQLGSIAPSWPTWVQGARWLPVS